MTQRAPSNPAVTSEWIEVEGPAAPALREALRSPAALTWKRGLDLAGATVLAALFALPLLAICVALRLGSGGPLFFAHERIGRNGRTFRLWKLRTMVPDAERILECTLAADPDLREEWLRDHKLQDDPRVTPFGRFLRRTSLDELPQLWNVLRGDMSLVGPRPIVVDEIERYGETFALYARVRPGITGLWQVSGRNATSYDRRVALDHHYVSHWSPWLDLYVLASTPVVVLRRSGAA